MTNISSLFPQSVQRRNVSYEKMSDSEITALSICSFRVHTLITLEKYITVFEITPVSVDDRDGIQDFVADYLNLVTLGDIGYNGEQLLEDMHSKGICLMSLKPSSYKTNWPKAIRQLTFASGVVLKLYFCSSAS